MAGCIALMMQASEDRSSTAILDRLVNYAKPIEKETDLMETPLRQGSGLVQVCSIPTNQIICYGAKTVLAVA